MITQLRQMLALGTIETLAFWRKRTTASEVADHLGLTRSSVQKRLIPLAKQHITELRVGEGGLSMNEEGWDLEAGEDGLVFSPGSQIELFAIDHAEAVRHAALGRRTENLHGDVVDIADVTFSKRRTNIFRDLYAAMRAGHACDVTYVTKKGTQTFRFSPHTLVKTTFRLHFRGRCSYEEGGQPYLDIVPSRVVMVNASSIGPAGYSGQEHDTEWQTVAHVSFKLRDDVGPELATALRTEFGEEIMIKTREALTRYVAEVFDARRFDSYRSSGISPWIRSS